MQSVRPFEFDRRFDLEALGGAAHAETLEREQADLEESERIEAEREAMRSIARAEGFEAGLAHARTEREAEMARLGAVMNSSLERNFAQAADLQGQVTIDAIALAVAIGEGLAGELIKRAPLASAETSITNALIEQFDRPRLTVKVAPKDREALDAFVKAQVALVAYEGRMVVQTDPTLLSGDCLIEWSDGGIRSIMTERRERVIGQLVALLEANKGDEAPAADDE